MNEIIKLNYSLENRKADLKYTSTLAAVCKLNLSGRALLEHMDSRESIPSFVLESLQQLPQAKARILLEWIWEVTLEKCYWEDEVRLVHGELTQISDIMPEVHHQTRRTNSNGALEAQRLQRLGYESYEEKLRAWVTKMYCELRLQSKQSSKPLATRKKTINNKDGETIVGFDALIFEKFQQDRAFESNSTSAPRDEEEGNNYGSPAPPEKFVVTRSKIYNHMKKVIF